MKKIVLAALLALVAAINLPAAILGYEAFLSGPAESPPNASPGTGYALVFIDTTAHTISYDVDFSGLIGTTTNAHIHAPTTLPFQGTAGVATRTPTLLGFPSGVTSGTFSDTVDMTLAGSWNGAYITANGGTPAGAEAALLQALADGKAYFNIHTSQFSGGEIRGFFTPVPEPGTIGLTALSFGGLAILVRRRRTSCC